MKKRDLTKEKVIQAAIDLANEIGDVTDLSLKRLAERLNIRTPSLYNHVKNQKDLHYWMAVAVNQSLLTRFHRAISGKFGEDALRAVAQAYRKEALSNPGVYSLFLKATPGEGGRLEQIGIELVNTIALLLSGLGLENEKTIHAIRAFRSGLHGFVSLELNDGFRLPTDKGESYDHLVELIISGLSHSYKNDAKS